VSAWLSAKQLAWVLMQELCLVGGHGGNKTVEAPFSPSCHMGCASNGGMFDSEGCLANPRILGMK
jgi:hypothetical protein